MGSTPDITFAGGGGGGGGASTDAAWGQVVRPLAAGRYFSSPCAGTGTFAMGNGDARFSPLFVGQTTTIDRLAVNVTVAGSTGAVTRLALFNDNGSFKPGTVRAQGTVDSTTTGLKTLTVSDTLVPGVYWVVAVNQGAPTTNATLTFISQAGLAMVHETLPGNNSYAWQATGITGAFANNPTVGAFFSPPRVLVRQV